MRHTETAAAETGIIITGAMGRMGREIASCVLADRSCSLAGCVEAPSHPDIGKDFGTCIGVGPIGRTLCADLGSLPVEHSVIIDLTSPEATGAFIDICEKRQTRLVIGTTGLDAALSEKIRRVSQKLPVVFSPNMSLGVNLLFLLTELAAKKLGGTFDIEIIEAHHRFKKDSPSGTAKKLGEIAASALGVPYNKAVRNGRSGITGERSATEIGMHSVRAGDIVGDHTVLFSSLGERLELRHMAHSRSMFARGAVVAAKWLMSQKPGLYTMRDVLGL
jgi:4-hydroxy-tetrahydrodipicolinate reductase